MSTGDEHIEEPLEIPDGSRVDFTTTLPFVFGSCRVWINGILLRSYDDDGWIETSDTSFRTNIPPLEYDTLHVRYIEK